MYIKEQDIQVKKIMKDYLKAVAVITYKEKGINILENDADNRIGSLMGFVSKVEVVLSLVDDETTFILYKEYMEKNKKLWWTEYYSRSTYYRHKARALNDFLKYYN